jgi:hypothetical protein
MEFRAAVACELVLLREPDACVLAAAGGKEAA